MIRSPKPFIYTHSTELPVGLTHNGVLAHREKRYQRLDFSCLIIHTLERFCPAKEAYEDIRKSVADWKMLHHHLGRIWTPPVCSLTDCVQMEEIQFLPHSINKDHFKITP